MSTAIAPAAQSGASLATIESLLSELNKKAEANTEAGGYDGATEHPVKKEDDRTEDAYVGSRARENEQDVKEDQGEPAVDGEPMKSAMSEMSHDQDKVQLNIGTKQRATGEDSESETARAKPGKDDSDDGVGGSQGRGQSSHPARTNNNEIDGHKWAADVNNARQLIKAATEKGNDLLGAIWVNADDIARKKMAAMQKTAMCATCGKSPCECKDGKCASEQRAAAKSAGASLASAVAPEGQVAGTDKQAEQAQVISDIADTLQFGWQAADKTAAFLAAYGAEIEKQQKAAMAEGGEEGDPRRNPSDEEEESESSPETQGGEGGGAPPMTASPEGGAGGEEDLLAALLEGGGAPEAGPPGMGEPPPAMMGADPAAGGMPGPGGMPGSGGMPGPGGGPEMGGMPGPGGGPEMGGGMPGLGELGPEELAMLLAALEQAQVSPEGLEAGAQAKAAAALAAHAKQAEAARKAARQAKQASTPEAAWQPKTAAEATRFQQLVKTIKELAAVPQ